MYGMLFERPAACCKRVRFECRSASCVRRRLTKPGARQARAYVEREAPLLAAVLRRSRCRRSGHARRQCVPGQPAPRPLAGPILPLGGGGGGWRFGRTDQTAWRPGSRRPRSMRWPRRNDGEGRSARAYGGPPMISPGRAARLPRTGQGEISVANVARNGTGAAGTKAATAAAPKKQCVRRKRLRANPVGARFLRRVWRSAGPRRPRRPAAGPRPAATCRVPPGNGRADRRGAGNITSNASHSRARESANRNDGEWTVAVIPPARRRTARAGAPSTSARANRCRLRQTSANRAECPVRSCHRFENRHEACRRVIKASLGILRSLSGARARRPWPAARDSACARRASFARPEACVLRQGDVAARFRPTAKSFVAPAIRPCPFVFNP